MRAGRVLLLPFPFDILDLLFTSQASVVGAELLALLAPSVIFLPLLTALNTALEASGRIRATVISLAVGALVKSVVASILIGIPTVGILGASISTSVSYLVSLLLSLVMLKKQIGISELAHASLPQLVIGAISFVPIYLFIYTVSPLENKIFEIVFCGALGSAIYLVFTLIYFYFTRKMAKRPSKCTKIAEKCY